MWVILLITLIIFVVYYHNYTENFTSEKMIKYFNSRHYSHDNIYNTSKLCSSNYNVKNVKELAKIWKYAGGSFNDCPSAIIIGSKNLNKDNLGGIWEQGFYNISPKKYGYCFDYGTNKENNCCSAKTVKNSLHKPSKYFGKAYTCYKAPKKIPKGFIGEGNNNFIGKFCHVGGENFYKEKQTDINIGAKYQWGGGQCSEGCNYSNNSFCKNNTCNDKYPFPYYYYDKFLKSLGITEKDKRKMKSKATDISKNICKKVYN